MTETSNNSDSIIDKQETISDIPSNSGQDISQDSPDDEEIMHTVKNIFIDDFDGNYARIIYNFDGIVYFGCISQTGKITYAIRNDEIGDLDYALKQEVEFPSYSNGSVLLCDQNCQLMIVDSEGNIVASQHNGDFDSIVAYGDGYYCTYTNKADFSSSKHEYSIIDGSGKVLAEHTEAEEIRYGVTYLGEGNFWFDYNKDEYALFNAENGYVGKFELGSSYGTLLTLQVNYHQRFNSGKIVLYSPKKQSYVLIDKKGNISEYVLYPDWYIQPISENKIIEYTCKNNSFNLFVHDLSNDEYYNFPEEIGSYIDKIDVFKSYSTQYLTDEENRLLKFVDGSVALNMTGEDGNQYIALTNCNKEILSPIKCKRTTAIHCGRMIVETDEDTYIYDTNGKVVFSLMDINAQSINPYRSNIAIAKSDRGCMAVDLDGNIVFTTDSIDFEHVEIISLTGG